MIKRGRPSRKHKRALRRALRASDVRASLAVRLAELRQERQLTQMQLARKVSTTQQMVSDIETYKHANVTLRTLQKLARALDTRLVVDLR